MSLFTRTTELKRFKRGALPKVAIAVLLVIPLIYGALYLWAFWAPTDNMNKLPVAVVNLDRPAEAPSGKTLTAGNDVVDELLKEAPEEVIVKECMTAAGLKDSRDPIDRINQVLLALHFEEKDKEFIK